MLETKRLKLRQFALLDHESLENLLADTTVMKFSDGTLNTDEVTVWLKNQIEQYTRCNGMAELAVEQKLTSQFIGYCGLSVFKHGNDLTETQIGYRLFQEYWGSGYATEAAIAVRDHAFSVHKLNKLVALIDPANSRSLRVAEKLGMAYEREVLMEHYDHPDHLYAVTRWNSQRG